MVVTEGGDCGALLLMCTKVWHEASWIVSCSLSWRKLSTEKVQCMKESYIETVVSRQFTRPKSTRNPGIFPELGNSAQCLRLAQQARSDSISSNIKVTQIDCQVNHSSILYTFKCGPDTTQWCKECLSGLRILVCFHNTMLKTGIFCQMAFL